MKTKETKLVEVVDEVTNAASNLSFDYSGTVMPSGGNYGHPSGYSVQVRPGVGPQGRVSRHSHSAGHSKPRGEVPAKQIGILLKTNNNFKEQMR